MNRIPTRRQSLSALFGGAMIAASLATATAAPKSADPVEAARSALRLLQFDRAIERLSTLSRAGNPDATYLLALMYLNGVGTPADPAHARELLQSAADRGSGAAAYVLAAELARGADRAPASSHIWLERSAKLGYIRAAEALKSGKPLLEREAAGASDPSLLTAWVMSCVAENDAGELRRLGAAADRVQDDFGRAPLARAAQGDKIEAAAALLELGADVDGVDRFGTTALMLAAEQANTAMLELLLQHHADPQAVDGAKRTALFYAARADRPESVKALLRAGALVGAHDERGYGALDAALTVGAQAAAAELRSQGAQQIVTGSLPARQGKFDPTRPGDIYRDWRPLAVAVSRDDTATVEQLLAAGDDVNMRLPQGDPLVKAAADARALGSLSILLAHGADPTAPDHGGHGVLWLAATRDDLVVLRALLAAGVAADAHAVTEQRPLLAALRAENPQVVRELLAAGASVEASDPQGHTPLMLAAATGRSAVVQILLEHHARSDARDEQDRTALWYAAAAGSRDIVVMLLAAGAGHQVIDSHGLTLLHAAAGQPSAAALEPLLAIDGAIDRRSLAGDTPLMIAAATGHLEVVRALLEHSAHLDVQNNAGDTALIVASRAGHSSICHLLLGAGANRALRNGAGASAEDIASGRGFASIAKEIAGKG